MSKLIISFMSREAKPKNPDHLFAILDTNNEKLEWIKLSNLPNTKNFVHGMGICYNQHYFCAGIIPIRERLASNLLTIDLSTGEKRISYLFFTKALHGIKSIDNNRLLATSSQTDIVSELILNNGAVICEDLYHHFIDPQKWNKECCRIRNTGQVTNYRGASFIDDQCHVNSIEVDHNYLYCTMFGAFNEKYYGNKYRGILYNMSTCEPVMNNLDQPHTAYIDWQGNICCCNSSQFTFIVKDKFEVLLDGYTRGICDDKEDKGYWVGISAYRKYNAHLSRWIEKYRGEQPLKGARIQFVDYDGYIKRTIELSQYGEEIFDILPHRTGRWN
jgi:hypothetical protein